MEKILDTEPITPTESYILVALLEKLANYDDMAHMEVIKKANELLKLINNP